MEATAKLITAVAALLGAIAWPIVVVVVLIAFRSEIRAFVSRVPTFLDRLRRMKFAGVEAELDALADKASSKGEVTVDQKRAAAQLAIDSKELGNEHLVAELDKLCLQYDTIRRVMPSSTQRTREMTRIIVKMRALGPSTSSRIDVYKRSGSAGSRLAAVAMMQMEPRLADLEWLLVRFQVEAPFVFYHAALVITNVVNSQSGSENGKAIEVANSALNIVRSFHGVPDQDTLDILKAVAAG